MVRYILQFCMFGDDPLALRTAEVGNVVLLAGKFVADEPGNRAPDTIELFGLDPGPLLCIFMGRL